MTARTNLAGEDIFQLEMQQDVVTEVPSSHSAFSENFEEKMHDAQEKLLELRKQQEMLERQKQELEELSQKQDAFFAGREELSEQLNRALATLERESFEAQKRVETFLQTKDCFANHLAILESLNPDDWDKNHLREELNRSLNLIEDARLEYDDAMTTVQLLTAKNHVSIAQESFATRKEPTQAHAKVQHYAEEDEVADTTKDFNYWLRAGFAFTLPLITLGLLALIILALK